MTGNAEPAAEIVPDRHAELGASLAESQESIAAVPSQIAAGAGADFPPCDLAADIVLGTVGEAEPVEMRRPGGLISEDRFRLLGQTAIRGADSARLRM